MAKRTFFLQDFETWWEADGQHGLPLGRKEAMRLAYAAALRPPAWLRGQRALEVETGFVWKIMDMDYGLSRVLLEPPDCTIKKEAPDGQWIWVYLSDLEPRWTQIP